MRDEENQQQADHTEEKPEEDEAPQLAGHPDVNGVPSDAEQARTEVDSHCLTPPS